MFVKQAHCVSMTRMFCCVTGKMAAELLSSCDDFHHDAVCVDAAACRASAKRLNLNVQRSDSFYTERDLCGAKRGQLRGKKLLSLLSF